MTADLRAELRRAELRRAYEERIRWHLDRARAYLAEVPERGALAVVSGQTVNAPPGAGGVQRLSEAGRADDTERERLGMPPRAWVVSSGPLPDPAFLPVGMTYAEALDLVDEAAPELAAALAEELEATAAALLVDEAPEVVAEVVAELPRGVAVSVRRRGRGWFALAAAFWLPGCAADSFARHLATGGTVEPASPAGGEYGAELAAWAAPRMRAAYAAAGADPALVDGFTRRAARGRIMAPLGVPGAPTFAALDVERLFRLVAEARRRWFALDAGREVRAYLGRVAEAPPLGWGEVAEALGEALAEAGPLAEVSEETRGGWAGALSAVARGVARRVVELPELDDEAGARGGAVKAAEVLAEALGKVGPKGARKAADVRDAAAERLEAAAGGAPAGELWRPWHQRRWLELLAAALWADKWHPEREHIARPVALHVTAMTALASVVSARHLAPARSGGAVLVNSEAAVVGRWNPRETTAVAAEALEALTRSAVATLATLTAVRFIQYFAHRVQRREKDKESTPVVFEGRDGANAYGVLAEELGLHPLKDAATVRALILALAGAVLLYADGSEAGVLLFDYRAGKGGRGHTSRLTLTPGRPWLSADVYTLPDGADFRGLTPIPSLHRYAPPGVGDRRDHAAEARLYLRILTELTRGSTDLARGLGVSIPGPRWAELLREEGVNRPPPLLAQLLQARWTQDGPEGPALFERVGPDRWHLGPSFAAERAMLEAGGEYRIGSANAGRASAEARASARLRFAEGLGKGGKRRG